MSFLGCDKKELPEGPWIADIEKHPAKKYTFEQDGYICTLLRQAGWNWNGYITLPASHPDRNKKYQELENIIQVHGDLTFSDGNGTFGFDTSHIVTEDIVPGDIVFQQKFPELCVIPSRLFGSPTFKTYEFVENELKNLIQQFKERDN